MDILLSKKTQLIEILSTDASYILQHVHEQCLISHREYKSLQNQSSQGPEKMVTALLDMFITKGKNCKKFLDILTSKAVLETFPALESVFEDEQDGQSHPTEFGSCALADLEKWVSKPEVEEKLMKNLRERLNDETFQKLHKDLQEERSIKRCLTLNTEDVYKILRNTRLEKFLKKDVSDYFPLDVVLLYLFEKRNSSITKDSKLGPTEGVFGALEEHPSSQVNKDDLNTLEENEGNFMQKQSEETRLTENEDSPPTLVENHNGNSSFSIYSQNQNVETHIIDITEEAGLDKTDNLGHEKIQNRGGNRQGPAAESSTCDVEKVTTIHVNAGSPDITEYPTNILIKKEIANLTRHTSTPKANRNGNGNCSNSTGAPQSNNLETKQCDLSGISERIKPQETSNCNQLPAETESFDVVNESDIFSRTHSSDVFEDTKNDVIESESVTSGLTEKAESQPITEDNFWRDRQTKSFQLLQISTSETKEDGEKNTETRDEIRPDQKEIFTDRKTQYTECCMQDPVENCFDVEKETDIRMNTLCSNSSNDPIVKSNCSDTKLKESASDTKVGICSDRTNSLEQNRISEMGNCMQIPAKCSTSHLENECNPPNMDKHGSDMEDMKNNSMKKLCEVPISAADTVNTPRSSISDSGYGSSLLVGESFNDQEVPKNSIEFRASQCSETPAKVLKQTHDQKSVHEVRSSEDQDVPSSKRKEKTKMTRRGKDQNSEWKKYKLQDWIKRYEAETGLTQEEIKVCIVKKYNIVHDKHPWLMAGPCTIFQHPTDVKASKMLFFVDKQKAIFKKNGGLIKEFEIKINYEMEVAGIGETVIFCKDGEKEQKKCKDIIEAMKIVKTCSNFIFEVLAPALVVYKKVQREKDGLL